MVVIDNVCKEYPNGNKAVDGVSLTVPEGETLVLVGTSGCGKTTTLKMINQLIKHTSGRILVGGQDVSKMDPVLLRRQIGYVIQQVGLMPHLNIMNNITFVLQITKQPKAMQRERAEEMLSVVGLPTSYLTRFPRELSGGEQQRIGVARALAADPDIILMDEPFGAVDPITRDQLQMELLRLQKKLNKTIIFVTHDIQEAFRLGTRIGVMRAGKLISVAKPMDLVLHEDDPFVKSFVGTKGVLDVLELLTVRQALIHSCPVAQLDQPLEEVRINLGTGGYALATDHQKRCLGKVSRSCILEGAVGGVISAEMIEKTGPLMSIENNLRRALEMMVVSGWSWLPIEENGVLAGIVTLESCSEIMRASES